MVLNIEKVRYKNFLSSGNNFIEVILDKEKLTLITGDNGCGKTSIIDAILFAFYGKTTKKITQTQIINSVNLKNCVVEVEFSIGSVHYLVRRALKPNKFEIYRDGTHLDDIGSNVKEEQKYLEEQILRMNYKTFTQIVLLSSANFIPFFSLEASARREITEDLLDISIFSKMKIVHKRNVDAATKELNEIDKDVRSLEERINTLEKTRDQMSQEIDSSIEEKEERLFDLQKTLEPLQKECDEMSEKHQALSNEIENETRSVQNQLNDARVGIQGIESLMKDLGNKHKFFANHSSCPTCKQDIDDEMKRSEMDLMKRDAKKWNSKLVEHKKKEKSLEQLLIEGELPRKKTESVLLANELRRKQSNLTSLQTSISHFLRDIRDLKKKQENQHNTHFVVQEIENLKKDLTQKKEHDRVLLKSRMRHYVAISDMLKDTGIRSFIVKDYLPVINRLMAHFLDKFDFFVLFQLDENFNETIKQRHYTEFSYSSFSEGQKSRLNLSMLFTFRELIKLKNAARVNLLFLDEIFQSSLDEEGKSMLLDLLRNLSDDENVFIISHTPSIVEDDEGFARHLKFEMKDGFSSYSEVLNNEE